MPHHIQKKIKEALEDLCAERELVNEAILALERVAQATAKK